MKTSRASTLSLAVAAAIVLAVERPACAQIPARPTNLIVTAVSSTRLSLQWTDNATNETLYKIERSPDNVATNFLQIDTVGAGVTNFVATNLGPAIKYYFRVRAANGSGDSSYSDTNSAPTLTPVEEWRRANFTPSQLTNDAVSGLGGDPDADGLSNLAEFAFASTPLLAGSTNAPQALLATDGTNQFLALAHTRNAAAIDARFVPEVSSDLTNWFAGSNVVAGPIPIATNAGFVSESFRDLTPAGSTATRQLRTRLTYYGVPNSWLTGSNSPITLNEVACGIVSNILYVVGANTGTNGSNTLAFDLIAGAWSNGAALARRPFPGNHHAAEVFGGRLYLMGGLGGGSEGRVQIYDPGSNVWTLGANLPWNGGSCASAVIGGFIYVAGGSVSGTATNRLARYDPLANTWTNLAPMPHGRHHAASGTDGGRLYVFGGRINTLAGFDDTQIYDPSGNTWTNSGAGSAIAPLPLARSGMGKAAFVNGEFYVMGGEALAGASGTTPQNVYNRVDIYDPLANTWRLATPMPTARHGIYPVGFGGRVYVACGGIAAGGGAAGQSTIFEIYLP